MKLSGIVKNGVVILDENSSLPEGSRVSVEVALPSVDSRPVRVQFPLVPSRAPGSVHLTNAMINEILDDEDAGRIAIAKPAIHSESAETAPNIPKPK